MIYVNFIFHDKITDEFLTYKQSIRKFQVTDTKQYAHRVSSMKEAIKLRSKLPMYLRKRFTIEKFQESVDEELSETVVVPENVISLISQGETEIDNSRSDDEEEVVVAGEESFSNDSEDNSKIILEKVGDFKKVNFKNTQNKLDERANRWLDEVKVLIEKKNGYIESLKKARMDYDVSLRKLSDYTHYMRFSNCSDSDLLKITKLYIEELNIRASIKDEIGILEEMVESVDKVANLSNKGSILENRVYRPKELDLFEKE